MEITVRIFFSFRRKLDTEKDDLKLELERGSTVLDALKELVKSYPQLKGEVLDGSDKLRRFIQVRLNQEGVEHLSGLKTELSPDDDLLILPKLGGG
ncbi:MAG: MoaD/ThiS family protein [Candidatus Acetothermia bacterium]